MSSSGFVDYVLDILLPLGNVKARKMFGGYGITKDGISFALIVEDILYFKVGDSNRADYEESGSQPFSYESKNGKRVAMSYWEVPVDVLENHAKLAVWVEKAVEAALRAKNK
jgi:DNA transformation protein